MSIKHAHALNPVTALAFYRTTANKLLLLAGEGPLLKVFEAETSELLLQQDIFAGQTIHGIVINRSAVEANDVQLAIWGGKCLTLLTKCTLGRLLQRDIVDFTGSTVLVSDWVLDVAISDDGENRCVLVTAHNKLIHAKFEDDGQPPFLKDLPSPSESILYSAHVTWDTQSQVLVAAGTVFGQIIVWQTSVIEEGVFGDAQSLFTFTGHEGSIFGVNISPPILDAHNKNLRLLASCSDDRTIRVWNLSESSQESQQKNGEGLTRETGFGKNKESYTTPLSSGKCMAVIMGHASRIWHVKFLVEDLCLPKNPSVSVLSFGEDATTQQWKLEPAAQPSTRNAEGSLDLKTSEEVINQRMRLRNVNTFAFHRGKHIWSTALWSGPHGGLHLATGGADSKISLYRMDMLSTEVHSSVQRGTTQSPSPDSAMINHPQPPYYTGTCELEEVLTNLLRDNGPTQPPPIHAHHDSPVDTDFISPPQDDSVPTKKKPHKPRKDGFNRYAFVSENNFLATTALGRILLGEIGTNLQWKELDLPESRREDLKSYTVLRGFPEISLACLAGTSGKVYVYKGGNAVLEMGSVEGKVADMFKIFDPEAGTFSLLVTTMASQVATLFPVDSMSENKRQNLERIYIPDGFVVTSAGICRSLLILGSRKGSLAVFDPRSLDKPLYIWSDPELTIGDSITTTLPLPSSRNGSSEKGYFLTTGRNGIYSIFSIFSTPSLNIEGQLTELQLLHRGTPPFGPMIEAGWFKDNMLILHGFKGKKFVVWNETKQYEIMNVECGGAHRSYAYSSLQGGEGSGIYIYTKASKLYVHSQTSLPHRVVKQGGHGREIKACATSSDGSILATGAEDTTIRIWHYDDTSVTGQDQFSCLSVIQKHTSGIQCLQWFQSKYLFSSGGTEEFFVWAVEEIPGFGIGVVCEATCPDRSDDQDLRVMSFDVTEAPYAVDSKQQPELLISLAYSDSTIRTYTYTKESGFDLVASARYTSSCITQIKHFNTVDNFLHLVTAATDGYLTLWKCQVNCVPEHRNPNPNSKSSELVMVSNAKIHQNSIKTLDFATSSTKDRTLIITGGDDNALGISVYITQDMSLRPVTYILKSAHAAAITGLCIMPGSTFKGGKERICVVSSSNDQRVKRWELSLDPQDTENRIVGIRKVDDVFTPVADVADMAALGVDKETGDGTKKVLLVGNGMEVWSISDGLDKC